MVPMNLSTEHIAELLAGIARSQQAIIDAIESENGGWRSTHLLPKLTTASNMRLAAPRMLDIPSRILLRSQGRVPMDVATIVRVLEEAAAGTNAPMTATATAASQSSPITAPAAATTAAVPASATGNNLDNFFDS